MCTFLTVGLDRRRAAAFATELRARFDLSSEVNPKIAALFEPAHALFMVTFGFCSCGLNAPNPGRSERDERARLRRFRKKGYSEARIARILAEPPKPVRGSEHHEALMEIARRHAPVRMCFHQVRGDPRTEEVSASKVDFTIVLP